MECEDFTLKRWERDFYTLTIVLGPPLEGTWQASFDNGANWVNGTQVGDDWSWLIAGPTYDAAAVGENPADTQATITDFITVPLLRIASGLVLDGEFAPKICLQG